MISLTCTSCQTTLSIDDAFAGGVCRCQHCGTIQTVPVRLKRAAANTPGTGPDEPAGNHSSAGTSGGGSRAVRAAAPAPAANPAHDVPRITTKWVILAAVVV